MVVQKLFFALMAVISTSADALSPILIGTSFFIDIHDESIARGLSSIGGGGGGGGSSYL